MASPRGLARRNSVRPHPNIRRATRRWSCTRPSVPVTALQQRGVTGRELAEPVRVIEHDVPAGQYGEHGGTMYTQQYTTIHTIQARTRTHTGYPLDAAMVPFECPALFVRMHGAGAQRVRPHVVLLLATGSRSSRAWLPRSTRLEAGVAAAAGRSASSGGGKRQGPARTASVCVGGGGGGGSI